MAVTRVNCPACKQQITVDVDQLLDVGQDPSAKQKLLSGTFNVIRCPNCGYQGPVPVPVVYHDPDNELLLTYFPFEMGLPMDEQERILGSLINRVTNNLPQEKRKAYLFRPQTMLTMQGLVEKVLETEGITKEMIQAQQDRLRLLQRLAEASDESFNEIATQEDELIDADFFNLASNLIQAALASGDQESAARISDMQKKLLPITKYGQELQAQSEEINAAIQRLQEAGDSLTREKLLDLVINAPSETQRNVIVSLARQGLDYEFFRLLSERIDRARGEGRNRLIELRDELLQLTQEIDRQIEARGQQAREILLEILEQDNVREAIIQYLPAIDEFFIQVLGAELDRARKEGDLERVNKLRTIEEVIREASETPAEVELIEELLEAPDDEQMEKLIEEHEEDITPEFLDVLSNVAAQTQSSRDAQLVERVQKLYQKVLRKSMQKNL